MSLVPDTIAFDASENGWSVNLSVPSPELPMVQPALLGVLDSFVSFGPHVESYEPVPYKEVAGDYIRSPHDDWYYRTHFLPPAFFLGNLSGDALRTMYMWNANFSSVNVEEFELVNGFGITYTTNATVPGDIGPLRMVRYDFTISVNGPPVIDAQATWTIDGVEYVVPITGRRVTLFPFKPNWSSAVQETLQWSSTVYQTYSGREQRMASRNQPRRIYQYNIRLHKNDSALFDVLTFGWQGRMYSQPIWNEGEHLTANVTVGALYLPFNTAHFSIQVGSSVALFRSGEDYEILQVAAIAPDGIELAGETMSAWPKGSKVFPLMTSIMGESLNTARQASNHTDAAMRFTGSPLDTLPRIPDIAPDALYLGEELYLRETNWRNGINIQIDSRDSRTDNGRGPIRIQPTATFPLVARRFQWLVKTKADATLLRGFFGRRKGRVRPVWMPSGADDFLVAGSVNIGEVSIPVQVSDYQSLIANHPARTHVLVIMRDGSKYARQIQSVTSAPDGGSLLTLNESLNIAFGPEDVKRISYLGLYRLGSDDVTFNWHSDTVAEVEVNFVLTEPTQE